MSFNVERIRHYLKEFQLKPLFIEELGWDHHAAALEISIDGKNFTLSAVAHKRGMVIFTCTALKDGSIPDDALRRRIEQQVVKSVHEHLIIYTDAKKTHQVWQWVKREAGKPLACRVQHYYSENTGEALLQKLKGLAISLQEEESISLVDVTSRARAAFDVERVTRRFYDCFKAEHAAFLEFLKGIPDEELQRWYASIMLNRLMFIYFIQKKGFLDGNTNYLRDKLAQSKQNGKDKFYKDFLCMLFFEGFATTESERSSAAKKLLGQAPYLNGGIFMPHQIETLYGKDIHIPDSAFDKLFEFFEQYQWHLDERRRRADNEINPDVLGYIFEKYINQKQMGAYYTKEDITGYISKNTVIPFLFDAAQKKCKIAFEGKQSVWTLLQSDPDRYIYDAVKKGVELPLHDEIAAGLNDASKRAHWNKHAPEEYALPTEIWREVVARRKRYEEVRAKLSNGEIKSINDFITYNLDIRQFAQDVIYNCEGPELLRAFWHAIVGRIPDKSNEKFEYGITILDPTCGSGAFLFAALNILEPLYEACLDRMQIFLDEMEQSGKKHRPEKFSDFKNILEEVKKHPSQRYFIFKSIIVNNLFGVDIMDEAVEICKLRLFLKLVAQVERVENLEPLPDIDFNIRAGNTLVGFATKDEVKEAITVTETVTIKQSKREQINLLSADDVDTLNRIDENAEEADNAFKLFQRMQTKHGMDSKSFSSAKKALQEKLKALEDELNTYLASQYGVDTKKKSAYQKWLSSHKPFHWFIDFYGIMKHGGFDVIIGNPPYVKSSDVKEEYTVKNYETEKCSDIYAWVLERVSNLLKQECRSGMIVPLSLGFSDNFVFCRTLLFKMYGENWFSSFGRIPSALFSFDVRVRNTIHIGSKTKIISCQHTTRLHRWFEAARPHLFEMLEYAPFTPNLWKNRIPKLNTAKLAHAFENCLKSTKFTIGSRLATHATSYVLHFKKTAYNWLNFCRILPPCFDENGNAIEHTKFGEIYFENQKLHDIAFLFLNGKILFIFWCAVGDDFDVTRWMFADFPLDIANIPDEIVKQVIPHVDALNKSMVKSTSFKLNAGKKVGNYNLAKCRHVTDKIDVVFADFLRINKVWDDLELYYTQMVKTNFDQNGENEEVLDELSTRSVRA